MDVDVVKNYTWNILRKQLQKNKISNEVLYKIIDNINEQLYSFIKNYNDKEFRNALLIIGSEEGLFYEPKNELIANMIVLTIRNSLLEGVASSSYIKYGSTVYLNDDAIKDITGEAIKYFEKQDLEKISDSIIIEYDYYKEIAKNYPVAINSLKELAKCSELNLEHDYKRVVRDKYELKELKDVDYDEKKDKNVESGIEPSFNRSLLSFLNDIKLGRSKCYITDCFKMTTRNFEKTLKILEFVLTHDGYFITCNYFIANNYVSRRKEILRASHTTEEFFNKINLIPDVSKKYHDYLEGIINEENRD